MLTVEDLASFFHTAVRAWTTLIERWFYCFCHVHTSEMASWRRQGLPIGKPGFYPSLWPFLEFRFDLVIKVVLMVYSDDRTQEGQVSGSTKYTCMCGFISVCVLLDRHGSSCPRHNTVRVTCSCSWLHFAGCTTPRFLEPDTYMLSSHIYEDGGAWTMKIQPKKARGCRKIAFGSISSNVGLTT